MNTPENEPNEPVVNDLSHDPLESKEYPNLHRMDVREYISMEPKMCENCPLTFLRQCGTSTRYCIQCRVVVREEGREYANYREPVMSINSRERLQ